ncbi:MAG: hypothetical protein ACR2QE_08290 [Acidimicrobiales bacterium]
MAGFEKVRFEFLETDTSRLASELRSLLDAADGSWVNLEPIVDDEAVDQLAVRRGMAGWMSGRGSDLPYSTWVAPLRGRRTTAASLGIQHGAGPKMSNALTEAGIVPPDGWVKRQDHSKRGLVYEHTGAIDVEATVAFVVAATRHLCPVELDGRWSAVVHRS